MRPAKTETTDGTAGLRASATPATWREGEEGGDVEFHAGLAELLDEGEAGVAAGVGDRDLGVNVGAPAVDLEGLALHLDEVVGEDFERDGFRGDGLEDVLGEGLVVADPGLLHQARVRRQALDVGLGVKIENAGPVRAVGVEMNGEVLD